jgi:hypothetical protein
MTKTWLLLLLLPGMTPLLLRALPAVLPDAGAPLVDAEPAAGEG